VRKLCSIFVLALLFANGVGFYCYYGLELLRIKAEMRRALRDAPSKSLQMVELTVDEFQEALVEEGEIFVNGKMFDIARVEKASGELLRIYGLVDEEEGRLFQFIGEIFGKPINPSSVPSVVINFLTLMFIVAAVFVLTRGFNPSPVILTYYPLSVSQLVADDISQPPEIC
jgi:hypothetical protein